MIIKEASVEIEVPEYAYYNPLQSLTRDVLVAIARSENIKSFSEPFSGIGIRSLRLFKEASIEYASVNDIDERQISVAKKILRGFSVRFSSRDARIYMLESEPFELVDLDQFGSPRRFIDAAIMHTRPGGILSFIVPNPGDLVGRFPRKCLRIYGSIPARSAYRFERGARIALLYLYRRASAFERYIKPLLVFRDRYYYKFFVRVLRGNRDPEIRRLREDIRLEFLRSHEYATSGPALGGKIFDTEFLERIYRKAPTEASRRLLERLLKESRASFEYYDYHEISGMLRMNAPKIKSLEASGCVRTHFYKFGVRCGFEELIKKLIDLRS